MAVWKLYRYEDQVLAPTMVITEEGVFVETQPVHCVSINSPTDMRELLHELISGEIGKAKAEDLNNPEQPDSSTQPVLLELLNIQRWKDFEKRALMYTLHRSGDTLTMHVTGRGSDGMWVVAELRTRTFDLSQSTEEACRSIADELITRRPIDTPGTLGLGMAMLPAPREAD
jgi:hypothetical protein